MTKVIENKKKFILNGRKNTQSSIISTSTLRSPDLDARPAGSKDKKKRKRSGYILWEANKRQEKDSAMRNNTGIEEYLNR